ncbi:MAG: 2-succinyl-6-hydroxy-2,4-cyclohexadiene-1-carboxylate synthase [Actinomycetota bacterium]|nr:2-succinyl-6-hydroxy-2,4-cyclohexadiene-1-carboxylate synthase [Actinomycetota bacterium]
MLTHHTSGSGARLVFIHGFTQTRHTWQDVAKNLSSQFEVVLVDAPNHGDSSDISLNLETGANAVIEVGQSATYVGYSMGARLCLTAALAHPQQVKRLVLISGTAGIENKDERLARVVSDEELAIRIEQNGVINFIDSWLALPIFSGLTTLNNQREIRLCNTATALASSLRLCGAGKQQPTWSRLKDLTMPVLIVAGENDKKFVELAQRLTTAIGDNAKLQIIKKSGHTPHLEQPQRFLDVVNEFLAN